MGVSTSATAAPRVGVVVVHYGDPAPTLACLHALARDGSPCERRIVVVDNSGDFPREQRGEAALIESGGNLGFGAGANLGANVLGPDPWAALVILNNDVEIADGYLAAAVTALQAPGADAAAGPLYLDQVGGTLWFAGGGINWVTGTVLQSTSPRRAQRERAVGFLPGAAFAVSVRAWRAAGGFDPEFFLYNEDVDFCLRLRRLGLALRFAPGMAAVHRLGAATGSAERSPFYLERMAATRLWPFRPLAYRLYLALLHSAYTMLRELWYRAVVGGESGRAAAQALGRGRRQALATIRREPARGPRQGS
jgi:N-acetylglucosaminyl-diphospho-decaprenol L-rhamnosyltransferase